MANYRNRESFCIFICEIGLQYRLMCQNLVQAAIGSEIDSTEVPKGQSLDFTSRLQTGP